LEHGELFIFQAGEPIAEGFSCVNALLHTRKEQLPSISEYVNRLFTSGLTRVNVLIDDLSSWTEDDLKLYQEKLVEMKNSLVDFFAGGKQKSLNLLTDRLFLERMNNCNAGLEHFTLGPDGNIYLCPAFYYSNRSMAIEGLQVAARLEHLLKLENAPLCRNCDAYHCQRCFFRNLAATEEINVPGEKQCLVAYMEREVSRQLQEELEAKKLIPFPNRYRIPRLNFRDPFQVSKVW